jgi:hypothetical protein
MYQWKVFMKMVWKYLAPPLLSALAAEAGLVIYLAIVNTIEPIMEHGFGALWVGILFAAVVVMTPAMYFFFIHTGLVTFEWILKADWRWHWMVIGPLAGLITGWIVHLDLTAKVPDGMLWPIIVMHSTVGGVMGITSGGIQWWINGREK